MSVFALVVVRPEVSSSERMVDAYFAVGDDTTAGAVCTLMRAFRENAEAIGVEPFDTYDELTAMPESPEKRAYRAAFERFYEQQTGNRLADAPTLVWSTDANPARAVQMQLFREWHLREFGEPVDIATDPSNRELTKAIVQSVAGAGPDIIEYIGRPELVSLVRAGIAYDVTDYAERHGFGIETVFEAVRTDIAVVDGNGDLRQYAYPCNVGYTVLLYHKDLFDAAGVDHPQASWTIDDMRAAGEAIVVAADLPARPMFAVMNLDPFNAALAAGGDVFAGDGGTHSVFNSAEAVAALEAYRALMYEHGAMPRPAEAASLSASTAGGFGSDVAGSAPGLFAQKSIAMYVGGRWEYVTFASANRDRVIVPAIDRELAALPADDPRADLLSSARRSLVRDVLVPISDDAYNAIDALLTAEDRQRLLHVGVAHVPTIDGVPMYPASARGAVVNRALERDDPKRLEYAVRFLRFLGSEAYNEQINGTFDSIAGRADTCLDDDGISGRPRALPGLDAFDSPVFVEAMTEYAEPWQLSEYIGRTRTMTLVGEVLQDLQSGKISGAEAASQIESRLNRQIIATVRSKAAFRERWEAATGVDIDSIDVSGSGSRIRAQIEAARAVADGGGM